MYDALKYFYYNRSAQPIEAAYSHDPSFARAPDTLETLLNVLNLQSQEIHMVELIHLMLLVDGMMLVTMVDTLLMVV